MEAWLTQRRTGAVARVIGAEGLGPRPSDDLLIVDVTGRTGGSLLAGAAQPEVISAAQRLLRSERSHRVVSLDIDPADATAAGLTCGGVVDILVQRLDVIPTQLWGPTGLDIGSRTPAETAVSIVAEIIAVRSARSGTPLTHTSGRISG